MLEIEEAGISAVEERERGERTHFRQGRPKVFELVIQIVLVMQLRLVCSIPSISHLHTRCQERVSGPLAELYEVET